MADGNFNLKQTVSSKVLQRPLLLGRVKMAQAIKMRESEWAKIIKDIEKDPLVRELMMAHEQNQKIIKYRRFKNSEMSGQFYEQQDANVAGGTSFTPEALLEDKKHLLVLIEKIGQDKFEKYFLYRVEGESTDNISNACGLTLQETTEIQDFILDMSVQTEFLHPSKLDSNNVVKPTLVGRIIRNEDGTYSMSFFSPHMARGQYDINRDALKSWQKKKKLNKEDSSKLRKFIGVLELANLKQGAFWRVMEYLLVLHKEYFDTQDESKMGAVSLRKVARHLQFAPSTISRVMGNKSVLLPWDREVLTLGLMPGQRKVVVSILEKMVGEQEKPMTDAKLAALLAEKHGIRVSRRTVTACRHLVGKRQSDPAPSE